MEIKINREIRNYTESMFFGLSMRQFIFAVAGCGSAVLLYFVLKPFFGVETLSWMCMLGAASFIACGFVTYNGMTAEQFAWVWLKSKFIESVKVKFECDTLYAAVTEKSQKEAKKTADASAKAAKMASQAARQAAQAAYKAAVVTAKAVAAAVKAAIAGIKTLAAAIAAGGWVAVVIIIVFCLVALIAGSCFGIFLSGDDTGTGLTMQTVISDINAEYEAKINETKGTVAYDVLEMSGTRAVWPDVLSVYAVKTAGDPNNPQEVATIDESKRQILKEIFWAMNEISFSTATKTENVVTETDDGNGNIVETTESMTRTYLYIRVSHKSPDEMAAQYGFTDAQKEQLHELLSEENKNMWGVISDL